MKSFRNYISEEVLPTAQVSDGALDVEKPSVRAAINAALAGVTSAPAVTPYVVYNRISKLLSQYHIILPRKFLEGDKGVEVFEVRQFGHKMGMTDQGEFINQVPSTHYLFLQYGIITSMGVTYAKPVVGGMYRVTARLVDKVELDRLLDVAEVTLAEDAECRQMSAKAHAPKEPMKDVDSSTEGTESAVDTTQRKSNKKLSAGKLDEVSLGKLVRYKNAAGKDLKHQKNSPVGKGDWWKQGDTDDPENRRKEGIKLADKKMKGKAKVNASAPKHPYMEETLDEISDELKARYYKKSEKPSAVRVDGKKVGSVRFEPKQGGKLGQGEWVARHKSARYTDIEHGADSRHSAKDLMRNFDEETVEEGRMPASVIKHKQRIANMTPEEKAKKFAGKSPEQLKSMARRHGYGKDSNEYSKHVKEEQIAESGEYAMKKFKTRLNTRVKQGLHKDGEKKTILVTRKGDPHAAMGGGVMRIPKDKWDPAKYNMASE